MKCTFNSAAAMLMVTGLLATASCKKTALNESASLSASDAGDLSLAGPVFQNYSKTPALVKKLSGFEGVEVYSLIGSDDTLSLSPNYVFGGSADGSGLLKIPGTGGFEGVAAAKYVYIVNHEDNYAVSRVLLDSKFKPIKGEYILNSNGGTWRLCSATMATPQEHGFGPTYLT
ncbi:MAG: hypothetical protein ABI921_10370, partial [Panacibacter sp.]